MAAALERGFNVRAEGRDAELLDQVAAERKANARSNETERVPDMPSPSVDDLVDRLRKKSRPEPQRTSPLDDLIRRQREDLDPPRERGHDDDRGDR